MSYRIEPDEAIVEGLKRAACEQLVRARRSLDTLRRGTKESVHDIRKRFKKVRAILRLLRGSYPPQVYKGENRCWRDQGRRLSDVRDAAVMVETLDTVLHQFADTVDPANFESLRKSLVKRRDALQKQVRDSDLPEQVDEEIDRGVGRLQELYVAEDGVDAIRAGLHKVYKRGYKGLAEVTDDTTDEKLHEWRKRVKYLWYHARLLRNAWPAMMKPLDKQLHTLARQLGQQHDMAEFSVLLRDLEDEEVSVDHRQTLLALVNRRGDELANVALSSGRWFYAEKPDAFTDRLCAWVEAWKRTPA